MRPVGGSATEASDGGIGARGSKSGGVAQESTAKTEVRVASAARHSLECSVPFFTSSVLRLRFSAVVAFSLRLRNLAG